VKFIWPIIGPLVLTMMVSPSAAAFSRCEVSLSIIPRESQNFEGFILDGKPVTLTDALTLALAHLPPGELKRDFEEQVWVYFKSETSVRWKARTPRTLSDLMDDVFRAITLIGAMPLQRLRRYMVYSQSRRTYLNEFLERATFVLQIQEGVFSTYTESYVDKILLPSSSKVNILLKRYIRLLRNLVWLREFKPFTGLKLDTETRRLIQVGDLPNLEKHLDARFSPDISIQWYLIHLRNIQTAGFLALAAILIPEVSGAYFHEKALERLEFNPVQASSLSEAQSMLNLTDNELRSLIREALWQERDGTYSQGEIQFFKEVDRRLN